MIIKGCSHESIVRSNAHPCQNKFWDFATALWESADVNVDNILTLAKEAAVKYLDSLGSVV